MSARELLVTCPACDGFGSVRGPLSAEAACDLVDCPACGGEGSVVADSDSGRDAMLESETPIGLDDDGGLDEPPDLDAEEGYDPYTGGWADEGYDTGWDGFDGE